MQDLYLLFVWEIYTHTRHKTWQGLYKIGKGVQLQDPELSWFTQPSIGILQESQEFNPEFQTSDECFTNKHIILLFFACRWPKLHQPDLDFRLM